MSNSYRTAVTPPRGRRWHLLATFSAMAFWIGCSPYVQVPNLYHPGTAAYQRANAVAHDPYPLDDVGPEIVGGRPRDYQRPVPEVDRARMFSPRRATQPLAIPYLTTPAPSAPPSAVGYTVPPAAPYPYSPPHPQPAPFQYAPSAPAQAFPSQHRAPY